MPEPPQHFSTQRLSERLTRPQQQTATQPNSLVLTSRQHEDRQRPSLELTTPSTFSAPGSCLLKPSLTGRCPCTQSQLCSLHME